MAKYLTWDNVIDMLLAKQPSKQLPQTTYNNLLTEESLVSS